ncbi:MAG: hypothetical protein ACXAC2_00025 [Candidatus Kariarchaeaceae archaeon]|jgi:hypothetical protein
MADNDDLIPDRAAGAVAFPTEASWDNFKETVNNNRRFRLLGVYTTGTITYNGTNSLSWTADIKVLFMATDSDTYYINTILSSGSPLTTADDNIIWARLVNSTSNITLNSSTVANFDRAGDLSNQSGDVLILGYTDTTRFHPIHAGILTVDEIKGGTGQISYTAGDILYSDATDSLAKLAKGTDGEVLTLASGLPSWTLAPISQVIPLTDTEESSANATYVGLTGSDTTVTKVTLDGANSRLRTKTSYRVPNGMNRCVIRIVTASTIGGFVNPVTFRASINGAAAGDYGTYTNGSTTKVLEESNAITVASTDTIRFLINNGDSSDDIDIFGIIIYWYAV